MIEVWLLLMLHCSGHVNAVCIPSVAEFASRQDCENARPRNARSQHGVCFPVARLGP
jgi:hypothetical protein